MISFRFFKRLYTWFILIIKHMHFIKIKTIHVLHISYISYHIYLFITQSLIEVTVLLYRPCYSRTLMNSPLFCTSPLWNYFFLVVENHCVFLEHIFWNCAFFPEMCVKNAKRRPTSIFSEKISPANDGLFVVDGLFVHEGLYVYVQLT